MEKPHSKEAIDMVTLYEEWEQTEEGRQLKSMARDGDSFHVFERGWRFAQRYFALKHD